MKKEKLYKIFAYHHDNKGNFHLIDKMIAVGEKQKKDAYNEIKKVAWKLGNESTKIVVAEIDAKKL